MARDPIVGAQILSCVNDYLAARAQAIPCTTAQSETRESQDEYGDLEFDYDDPSLDAMLGIGRPVNAKPADAENSQQEAEFCEVSGTHLIHTSERWF